MPDLTPPDDLPPLPNPQRTIWAETATRLIQLGRGDSTDTNALRAYVVAVAKHRRASSLIDSTDILIIRDGAPVPSPALAIQAQAEVTLSRLSNSLGLNKPPRTIPDLPQRPAAPQDLKGDQEAKDGPQPDPKYPGARWCVEHGRWECRSNKSRGRGQCHALAMEGLPNCRAHKGRGGSVKHLVAVETRRAQRHWQPIETHPAQALLQEVAYQTGLCEWLDDIVGSLQRGEMAWGMVSRDHSTGWQAGVKVVEQAGMNVWVAWQERAHLAKARVAGEALKSEAAAAMLRLQQTQGMVIFRAFQDGLNELELTEAQWAVARDAMPKVLRALTAA